MEITIHEEKISHFTFHGEKKGPVTSHENTLYHPLESFCAPVENVEKTVKAVGETVRYPLVSRWFLPV